MAPELSDTLEGSANPFPAKEPPSQSSPLSDRKKNRRKKSMNQKGEAVVGQAEGENTSRCFVDQWFSPGLVCTWSVASGGHTCVIHY